MLIGVGDMVIYSVSMGDMIDDDRYAHSLEKRVFVTKRQYCTEPGA